MKISTKGRYSLILMLDIAKNQIDNKYVSLKEVSKRTDISEKYLENIVKTLVKNNLLLGLRGKGGGYKLTKKIDEYTVYEILKSCEENILQVEKYENYNSLDKNISSMLNNLDKKIINYFSEINLSDLLLDNEAYIYYI